MIAMIKGLRNVWPAFLVALSATMLVCIVLPIQSYMVNASLFNYSLTRLLAECLVLFVISQVLLTTALHLSQKLTGRFLFALVVSFSVCEYLETGILAYGLGALDGNVWLYTDVSRKIIDSSILLGVFLLVVSPYKWLKGYYHFVAIGVVVMSLASLLDMNRNADGEGSDVQGDGFCSKYDVAKSLSFSNKRNVLVLVLDSFPASTAGKIMDEHPELKEMFAGFTAFDNNIAMHDVTRRGMPGLLTGEYYGDGGVSLEKYSHTLYGTNSFVYPYMRAPSNTIHMLGGVYECGYTNKRLSHQDQNRNTDKHASVFYSRSSSIPYLNLYETIKFRMTPYKMKSNVLWSIINRINAGPQADADRFVVSELLKMRVDDSDQNMLMLHTRGIHLPILTGKNGERLACPNDTSEGLKDFGYYLLKMYADLFSKMMERGLYDKTMIVITTDHGSPLLASGEDMGQPDAMLWVKPIGSSERFTHSNLPTSHCKVASVMRDAFLRNLSAEEISKKLHTPKRLYRGKPSRTSPFYDWIYDEKGRAIERRVNDEVHDS